MWPAPPRAADGFLRGAANFFGRGEEDSGVHVALDGDVGAELLAEGAHVDAPVDAEDVGTGAGDSGEKVVGGFGVIDDGSLWVADARAEIISCTAGRAKLFVIAEGEFAAPGVEELDGGGACGDLGFQIGDGGLRDAMEEIAKSGGFAEQETFHGGEAFFGAAFDHVAGQSPGSGRKAQNGNGGADFADDAANGFGEEGGFDFGVEEF